MRIAEVDVQDRAQALRAQDAGVALTTEQLAALAVGPMAQAAAAAAVAALTVAAVQRVANGGAAVAALVDQQDRPALRKPGVAIGAAHLAGVLAYMQQLRSKATHEGFDNDLKMLLEQKEAQNSNMLEEAKKAEEAERKAKEAQKVMGCIGDFLMAISVIAGVLTGGLALAVTAVLVIDKAVEAATGKSLVGEAMKPLMDAVIKPLLEGIGKLITGALKAFGVADDMAQMLGSILSTVVTAVAAVTAAFVIKKLPTELLTKALGKLISKVLPEFMKTIGKGATGAVKNATGYLQKSLGGADKAKLMANTAQRTAVVTTVVGVAAQSGLEIYIGFQTKYTADAEAELEMAIAQNKALGKMIQETMEQYARFIEGLSQSFFKIFEAVNKQMEVSKSLLALPRLSV